MFLQNLSKWEQIIWSFVLSFLNNSNAFSLLSKDRFFVIDLIVADISLVVTKRSEFNSMLKKVDNNLSKFNDVLFDQNQESYQKIIE